MMHIERISVDQYLCNYELCLLIYALRSSLLNSVARNNCMDEEILNFEMKQIAGLIF